MHIYHKDHASEPGVDLMVYTETEHQLSTGFRFSSRLGFIDSIKTLAIFLVIFIIYQAAISYPSETLLWHASAI